MRKKKRKRENKREKRVARKTRMQGNEGYMETPLPSLLAMPMSPFR